MHRLSPLCMGESSVQKQLAKYGLIWFLDFSTVLLMMQTDSLKSSRILGLWCNTMPNDVNTKIYQFLCLHDPLSRGTTRLSIMHYSAWTVKVSPRVKQPKNGFTYIMGLDELRSIIIMIFKRREHHNKLRAISQNFGTEVLLRPVKNRFLKIIHADNLNLK